MITSTLKMMGRLEEEVPASTRIFGVHVNFFFTYPTKRESQKNHHLQKVPAGRGYVSSLEGVCFFELVYFKKKIRASNPRRFNVFGKFHVNDSYRAM